MDFFRVAGGFRRDKPGQKRKGPELGNSGPALRGVGGGRGLAARDAVCVVFIVSISDPDVHI